MPTNRILTDADREFYQPEVDLMNQHCPAMMGRKIQDAVVQQAFVLNTVLYRFTPDFQKKYNQLPVVLSAGSYEDTAGETLRQLGFNVIDVDPVLNEDLHSYRLRGGGPADVIISTSVLEHVENDEEFLVDSAHLLLPGGVAVFTMDFMDEWQGGATPTTSRRFYRNYDLVERLPNLLRANGCDLIDTQDYSIKDRFYWEGFNYSFATFVFIKQ
jgi:hypothetical protein